MGCRSLPTVAGSPSIVVMRSVDLICPTGTEHGLNFLPLMWLVQAWQTPMPQPYLGPLTPRMSRMTQSRRTSLSTSTRTRLPLRMKVCTGIAQPLLLVFLRRFFFGLARARTLSFARPSVGDSGIGGAGGDGAEGSGARGVGGGP